MRNRFSLGYACVRSAIGWANAHAIVGACAHAALAAIAFEEPNGAPDPAPTVIFQLFTKKIDFFLDFFWIFFVTFLKT